MHQLISAIPKHILRRVPNQEFQSITVSLRYRVGGNSRHAKIASDALRHPFCTRGTWPDDEQGRARSGDVNWGFQSLLHPMTNLIELGLYPTCGFSQIIERFFRADP